MQVRKRDGRLEPFEPNKIRSAVNKAWNELEQQPSQLVFEKAIDSIMTGIMATNTVGVLDVEVVQDLVEFGLLRAGQLPVARVYMSYRQRKTVLRGDRLRPDNRAIADYIHVSKYARYQSELLRRETHLESSQRVLAMHRSYLATSVCTGFPAIELLDKAWEYVDDERVLPSMRSLQFGGQPILRNHSRLYNCSASHADRIQFFSEMFFLLLSGSGVGYSVQWEHVNKLPTIPKVGRTVRHYLIQDSIEGWADAILGLFQTTLKGEYIEFSYDRIRPEGSPLVTSGGKAPGHLPLKTALEKIRDSLYRAANRKLRPIEVHDICCYLAEAVLAGGIRRSSLISIFSPDDAEMLHAKTGDWYPAQRQREMANNSVCLLRGEANRRQFKRIIELNREFGEPGFYFTDNNRYTPNPCVEIGMDPVYDGETGFSFCNLTTINGSTAQTVEDFYARAEAAAVIGTVQACYTKFSYLGDASRLIAERDALLGVSISGIMDNPDICLNPKVQLEAAQIVIQTNRKMAKLLGINASARLTTVKPEGTSSLKLGAISSGIHFQHARRYIRRVTANRLESPFLFFKKANPHMCVEKANGDWVIEFPIEVPSTARLKEQYGAIEFLEMVKSTYTNWVLPGTQGSGSPGLTHNVSTTCHVKDDEWERVADYLFENQFNFAAVAFLPVRGDKIYSFAPLEAIISEADEVRWNQLISKYHPVDYTQMLEDADGTDLAGEAACAGGKCDLP